MPTSARRAPFRQTKSIARRLRWTVFLIAAFFILEFAGLYAASFGTFRSFSQLHEITVAADLSRQGRELLYSIQETLDSTAKQEGRTLDQALKILDAATQREIEFIRSAREAVVHDAEAETTLALAEEAVLQLDASLARMRSGDVGQARLVANQFILEALEQLRKTQIHLTARADLVFRQVTSNWNKPALMSALIALVFLALTLWIGLSAARRLSSSLSALVRATNEVTAGNMQHRAEIVEPDEIGHLANAFNTMTEALEARTVSRDYVEAIIESMRDAVVVFDEQGRVRRVNETTKGLFGFDSVELEGQPIATLFENPPSLGEQIRHLEIGGVRKDGSLVPVELSINGLAARGPGRHYVAVIKDITERKRAQSEIERRSVELAAANRELEAFSYSVSHDLRAPLRAIDGFSHALLEENGDRLDEQGKKDLGRVRAASQTMGKLIDDLLNLSRLSRTEMKKEDVDLSSMVEDIARGLRESDPQRKVEFVIQPGLHAEADPSLIRIALDNLLSNAWKYTSKHPTARIEFGLAPSDGKSAFFIRDDGAGFDPAFASRLFGAFQRLHSANEFPGTGIGLATVQRILRRHGGTIWAEGQIEKGSTFYFTL